ncbi:MAG: hypothetical protein LBR79_06760 [Oscillospiraceae bacterium]|nr:hypothetical protein [Oscillospiraceae bacterium]
MSSKKYQYIAATFEKSKFVCAALPIGLRGKSGKKLVDNIFPPRKSAGEKIKISLFQKVFTIKLFK